MLLKILFAFLLFTLPASAQVCATGQVIANEQALTGASCAPLPPQKSDLYTATTGFTYTVPNGVTIEVITSATILANGTIILPAVPTDGMPLTLEAPKGVTFATVQANTGQTISGTAIATFAANMPYRLKYSGVNSTWYPN